MKSKITKLLALALSMLMLTALLPVTTFAAVDNPSENVQNGDIWSYRNGSITPVVLSDFDAPIGAGDIRLSQQVIADNDDGTFDVEVKVQGGSDINFTSEGAIVLVLDDSNSITNTQWNQMKNACLTFVGTYPKNANIYFGIVTFGNSATVVSHLSNNRTQIINSLLSLTHHGENTTNIGEGIVKAKDVLDLYEGNGTKTAIVVTDGMVNVPAPSPITYMQKAADELKYSGADIFAVGVGSAYSLTELNMIASVIPGLKTIYEVATFSLLEEALLSMAPGDVNITMGSGIDFVSVLSSSGGSDSVNASGGTIIWKLENDTVNTLVYRIRVNDSRFGDGFVPVSDTPLVRYVYGNRNRIAYFDVPYVQMDHCTIYGHEWGDWVVSVLATCDTDGVEIRECIYTTALGDTHEERRAIPALGHDWGEWTVTTPATCDTEGMETRECNRCGETETRVIPTLGHDWGEWTVTTPATCDTEGVETRECNRCGETETRAIPTIGHDYVAVSVVTSSTNLQNNTTVTITIYGECTNCGDTIVLASQSVKLKQNGTQTVKVGGYDVTVVVNSNNKITNVYLGAPVSNGGGGNSQGNQNQQ